jgi:hypothetical protein
MTLQCQNGLLLLTEHMMLNTLLSLVEVLEVWEHLMARQVVAPVDIDLQLLASYLEEAHLRKAN